MMKERDHGVPSILEMRSRDFSASSAAAVDDAIH
jgi:hypothetical protein